MGRGRLLLSALVVAGLLVAAFVVLTPARTGTNADFAPPPADEVAAPAPPPPPRPAPAPEVIVVPAGPDAAAAPLPDPIGEMQAPEPEMIVTSAPPAPTRGMGDAQEIREVPIYFATNRTLAANPDPDDPTSQFTDTNGAITWGQAIVSLPPHHKMGELESQGWFSAMLFDPDPEKHVVVQSMDPVEDDILLGLVRDELARTENGILMYVHGYNTSLDKAVRRTGQLTYDLAWHGPSFLFSWPSLGDAAAYFTDSTMAARSEDDLARVLTELAALDPDRFVIISHSMGTRVLSGALATLAITDPGTASEITTVILAAPDIDEDIFHRQLAPRFREMQDSHFTLYASSEDTALKASKAANGFPRIGDTTNGVPFIDGIDVIDASDTVSDFFGHTYFGDNATILSDIFTMVHEGTPVDQRPTIAQIPGPPRAFWKIVVD